MKTFRLKANATFEAEGIENALSRLSDHFRHILYNIDAEIFFTSGEFIIEPISEEEK